MGARTAFKLSPCSALEVDLEHQVKHSLINHINMLGKLNIFTVGSEHRPLTLPWKAECCV